MKKSERINTIMNVISDLQAILDDPEATDENGNITDEFWRDAQLSSEHITHNAAHL